MRGHATTAKLLEDQGADINAQGEMRDDDAKMSASCNGNENVVQRLLDGEANINAQGGDHDTTLQVASNRSPISYSHRLSGRT